MEIYVNQDLMLVIKRSRSRPGLIPYYRSYLLTLGIDININHWDPDEYIKQINTYLQNNINPESIPDAIESIESTAKNTILDLAIFDWLKDDIACCYTWMRITNTPAFYLGSPQINGSLYHYILPNRNPVSTSERYELIINFFDYWNNTKERKILFLEELKSYWSCICSEKKPFPWLNKNDEEMCTWVWDYLRSSGKLPIFYTPTNNEEKYIASYSTFYIWNTSIEAKTLLLQNINKAKNQNKFRKSIKTKQAINTYINKDTKKKLDLLATKNGKKLNEMLEIIINREFSNSNINN